MGWRLQIPNRRPKQRAGGPSITGDTISQMRRCGFLIVLIGSAFGFTSSAAAQMISLSPQPGPVLGATIRGSTPTTFSITTTGVVLRTSGDAIRMSNGTVTTPTVSFNCTLLNFPELCLLRPVRVTITPASAEGAATISRLRISNLSGTTYRSGTAPPEALVLVFDLNPLLLSTVSFKLGMDIQLQAGAASGNETYSYTVSVTFI